MLFYNTRAPTRASPEHPSEHTTKQECNRALHFVTGPFKTFSIFQSYVWLNSGQLSNLIASRAYHLHQDLPALTIYTNLVTLFRAWLGLATRWASFVLNCLTRLSELNRNDFRKASWTIRLCSGVNVPLVYELRQVAQIWHVERLIEHSRNSWNHHII